MDYVSDVMNERDHADAEADINAEWDARYHFMAHAAAEVIDDTPHGPDSEPF